jgi:hypothetical protein
VARCCRRNTPSREQIDQGRIGRRSNANRPVGVRRGVHQRGAVGDHPSGTLRSTRFESTLASTGLPAARIEWSLEGTLDLFRVPALPYAFETGGKFVMMVGICCEAAGYGGEALGNPDVSDVTFGRGRWFNAGGGAA